MKNINIENKFDADDSIPCILDFVENQFDADELASIKNFGIDSETNYRIVEQLLSKISPAEIYRKYSGDIWAIIKKDADKMEPLIFLQNAWENFRPKKTKKGDILGTPTQQQISILLYIVQRSTELMS